MSLPEAPPPSSIYSPEAPPPSTMSSPQAPPPSTMSSPQAPPPSTMSSPEAPPPSTMSLPEASPPSTMSSPQAPPPVTEAAQTYGELIVLGCNGALPGGDKGRRRSHFALTQRSEANSVKPGAVHTLNMLQTTEAISNKEQHSILFTLSQEQTLVVEYTHDNSSDMFQLGRSTEDPIDFVVTDVAPGGAAAPQSTVSRFACRIVCQRTPPHSARIYAAGFDSSHNIFLGEKSSKWRTADGRMDGLTTNGVLLMRPWRGFSRDPRPGPWREVSVCGAVLTLRETRSAQQRGERVDGESNELLDGSLIDLCGVTLLWRSAAAALACGAGPEQLEALRRQLNAGRPQCPVGLNTLAFPSLRRRHVPERRQPWAYLRCGHVHGYHGWAGRWGGAPGGRDRECPLCRTRGPYVALWLGCEAGVYMDPGPPGPPSHAFVPCGHICSQQTAAYWCRVTLPQGDHPPHAACPFCSRPLEQDAGCIRLIFQSPLDENHS